MSRFSDLPYQHLELLIYLSKEGLNYIMVNKVALDQDKAIGFIIVLLKMLIDILRFLKIELIFLII